jgi:hypothetical protein
MTEKPKMPSTGAAKAIGTAVVLGTITTVPLVGLIAAPFLLFKPIIRMATNTVAKQNAAIAAQGATAQVVAVTIQNKPPTFVERFRRNWARQSAEIAARKRESKPAFPG